MSEPAPDADDDRVSAFWEVARFHARLNSVPSYFGPTVLETVQPPTWSFGGTPEEADEGLAELLEAGGSTTRTPRSEYEAAQVPLPVVGTLGIVLDGAGAPAALVETVEVSIQDEFLTEVLAVLHRT